MLLSVGATLLIINIFSDVKIIVLNINIIGLYIIVNNSFIIKVFRGILSIIVLII